MSGLGESGIETDGFESNGGLAAGLIGGRVVKDLGLGAGRVGGGGGAERGFSKTIPLESLEEDGVLEVR